MTKQTLILLALGGAVNALPAAIDITLPGNTEQAIWQDMNSTTLPTSAGYNSFPTNTAGWTTPVSADNGSAVFDKVAGTGGYPATASIYNFDQNGTFTVSDASPIANMETLVFQTDMIGSFFAEPTLSYNGGAQALTADFTASQAGDFSGSGSDSIVFAYQWNFSGIVEEITTYEITWTSGFHASNYLMQVNTGNTFTQTVPEPGTYALIAGACCCALLLMRRQRR